MPTGQFDMKHGPDDVATRYEAALNRAISEAMVCIGDTKPCTWPQLEDIATNALLAHGFAASVEIMGLQSLDIEPSETRLSFMAGLNDAPQADDVNSFKRAAGYHAMFFQDMMAGLDRRGVCTPLLNELCNIDLSGESSTRAMQRLAEDLRSTIRTQINV